MISPLFTMAIQIVSGSSVLTCKYKAFLWVPSGIVIGLDYKCESAHTIIALFQTYSADVLVYPCV